MSIWDKAQYLSRKPMPYVSKDMRRDLLIGWIAQVSLEWDIKPAIIYLHPDDWMALGVRSIRGLAVTTSRDVPIGSVVLTSGEEADVYVSE